MDTSEGKQTLHLATLDDLGALVEKAARTIMQLQSEAAVRDQRIKQLEQTEAQARLDAEQWREVLKMVREHGSITINLNPPDASKPDLPAA